jgi:type I restriction enzyme, R subunit
VTERDWNEETLVEIPALDLLRILGYQFLEPAQVALERDGQRSAILSGRLARKLRDLNPWISDDNVTRAVRAVTNVNASGFLEANETLHTLITRGMSVQQEVRGRTSNPTVQFVDFENPNANEWLVTRQFRVVRDSSLIKQGRDDESRDGVAIFDLAVFVNGLPFAVIECKSPFLKSVDPIQAATAQLERYQEIGDRFQGRGVPQAFASVQVLVAICRERAMYGSVGAPGEFFAPFPETYPQGLDFLEGLVGRTPTMQDVLLYSVLEPGNLLEFTKSYVVFEVEKGRTIKKLARHQQRIAVDLTVRRLRREDHLIPERRSPSYAARKAQTRWHLESDVNGGVIWHTQGSGKSLTMVWLAQKLRQASLGFGNPTVVVISDRTDLDKQIARTFDRVGIAAPKRANSIGDLRTSLKDATGLTLMTTVQKFQDASVKGQVLNDSSNLYVMVDEAHRTQYGELAAKMRRALPNATFIAFTGTPIDKQDRSTVQSFGPYIHKYTMEESVRDGATVPIFYEGRDLERLGVAGSTVDVLFERFFAERSPDERERIKGKYATVEAIAGAPARIREIVMDLVQHYEEAIAPNHFKGQVVAVNRETAVRYFEELERIPNSPSAKVIFTGQPDDPEDLAKHHTTKAEQDEIIEQFKNGQHPQLLIVVDMLLTGFDAPIEQVMYLDKNLREHNLLQAIARVNRPAPIKNEGFVIDYWGVTEHLQEALEIFAPEDLDPNRVMRPKSDELPRLEARRRRAMSFFEGKNRDELEILLRVIEPPDVRIDFDLAFRQFAQSMNMMLPDVRALEFSDDLRWLGRIRDAARQRFRDDTMDWTGVAEKVKSLINDYIIASGVKRIIGPVSIFSREFDEVVARLGSDEAKASEMAHATRHELTVRYDENPVFYESLQTRLEEIIEQRRANRISAAEQLAKLESIVSDLRSTGNQAQELKLSTAGFAIYKLLEQNTLAAEPVETLARTLENVLRERIVIDWTKKDDVLREMRRQMRRELITSGIPRESIEPLLNNVMDVAKSNPEFA